MSGPWEDYQQTPANPWDEYAAAPVQAQGNAASDPGILANAARALRMGLPFGNQFVAAEKTFLPQALGGAPGFDYGQNLADVNAADARLQQHHPIIANLGQGTGAAIGALAVPTAALGEGAQGLGVLGRSIRGGLAGASVGAVQGAGAPGSDIRNIPQTEEGAVSGLYTGGALGSAFPAVGAGIGAAYNAIARPEVNMLTAALHGISPAEMASAQALMQDAANRGIRLTSAEAIQQVTGAATDLGRLQRIVEGTKGGASVMAPFMAERPAQVQNALSDALNRIAPPPPVGKQLAGDMGPLPAGIAQTPGMTGAAGQKAATDALMAAERARTAAVTPLYEAAGKDTVPLSASETPEIRSFGGTSLPPQVLSGNMTDFLDSLATQAAQDKTGIVGPKLLQLRNDLLESKGSPTVPATRTPVVGPDGQVIRYETTPAIDAIPPKPLTDLESLDRVRKYHRDILDLPQIGQDAITKEQNAAVANALGRLNDLMEANSKPFVAAKQKFQELTARDVAPAATGPLGKIAATPEVRTQTNALFPTQPSEGAPQETARAVAALNQQDPQIAAQLARQHLASNFAERAQQNIPGENQWGGAKFAAHITGNPLQADVLNQGLTALPHGAAVAPDVNALLEALRATGKRQAPGSLTAQNTLDLKDLSAPGAIGTALHAAHSPVSAIPAIISQLGDAATRARLYGHSATLAQALTADPVSAFNAIAATRQIQRPVSRASMAAALAANADLQAQRNQAIAP